MRPSGLKYLGALVMAGGVLAADTPGKTVADIPVAVDGLVRIFWIDSGAQQRTTATATGGMLGLTSGQYFGFSGRIKLMASARIARVNPQNDASIHPAPYDGTQGYIYLSEAALRHASERLKVQAGRIRIDTPYADSDDIRMAPNTFEGIHAGVLVNDTMQGELLCVTRWAGTDSADAYGNQSTFRPLDDASRGMAGAGFSYAPAETLHVDLWSYFAEGLFTLLYAEAGGDVFLGSKWRMTWGLQGAAMNAQDDSGTEGYVIGADAFLTFKQISFGGAFNEAIVGAGHAVTDGFGGGPYFTSLDESTVASVSQVLPGHNVAAVRAWAGVDLAWWPHEASEGLQGTLQFGHYDIQDSPIKVREHDLTVWFGWDETLQIDGIFANYDIQGLVSSENRDFTRYWLRLDYRF